MIQNKKENINEPVIAEHMQLLNEAKKLEDSEVEREISQDEDFTKIIKELPENLRPKIKEKIEILKKHGFDRGEIWRELNDYRELTNDAYRDSRFEGIVNGKGLRRELSRIVDTLVSEKLNLTKVHGLGMINFDVNGLKSINDLAGHDKGTIYLKRVVDVLNSGKITNELRKKGINVTVAVNGGDEFAIVLSDDVNLTEKQDGQSYIDAILKQYQAEISSIETSDLLDFSEEKVRKEFEGVEIPEGYKFIASISGGTALLDEILGDDRVFNEIEDIKGYKNKINRVISHLFNISDERAREDKEIYKINLDASEKTSEKFQGMVLKRNKEVREKQKEIDKLRKADTQKIDELLKEVEGLKAALAEAIK